MIRRIQKNATTLIENNHERSLDRNKSYIRPQLVITNAEMKTDMVDVGHFNPPRKP